MLDSLMAEYEVEGGNTRDCLLAWLTTGVTYLWEAELKEYHKQASRAAARAT